MKNNNGDQGDVKSSQIILTFAGPGSSEFQFNSEGITPAQVLGAAAWLDWYARRLFDSQSEQIARNKIVVPGVFPNIKL